MINTRIWGQQYSFDSSSSGPKSFRNTYAFPPSVPLYLLPYSLSEMAEKDNQAIIRKYYPKKLVSVAYVLKRLPNYLVSCTKGLKSLTTQFPQIIQGSPSSIKKLQLLKGRYGPKIPLLQFKKAMLAYKNVNTLKLNGFFDEQTFTSIMYMRNLQVLDVDLKDNQLGDLNKSVEFLDALESISLFIRKNDERSFNIIMDAEPFLDFCQKTLAKKTMKALKLRFDRTIGHYSSDTFEKLFAYIEKSKLERWDLQTALLEDEVLRITEAYAIFKHVQRLAVYSGYSWSSRPNGFNLEYCSFDEEVQVQERPHKAITIYLMEKLEPGEEGHQFELKSILRECPKIECFFIEWDSNLLKEPLSLVEDFKGYQSLKTIYFNLPCCMAKDTWLYLFQILEDTPFLEKLYVYMLDLQIGSQNGTQGEPLDSVDALTKQLTQLKTLRSLELNIFLGSQPGLDALHEYLENIQGLEELSLYLYFDSDNPVAMNIDSPGKMQTLSFDKMTELTKLRLGVIDSVSVQVSSMINAFSKMDRLNVLEFRNPSTVPLSWDLWVSLMKESGKLTELKKLIFYPMSYDSRSTKTLDEIVETMVDMVKQEIKKMANHSKKLSYAKLQFYHLNDRVCIEYIK